MYLSGLPKMDILKPSCACFIEDLTISKGLNLTSSQPRPTEKIVKHTTAISTNITAITVVGIQDT